jgi:hypothetical protein
MNKLIKLPDGPYIRADQIIQISEPFQDMRQWCYSIGYKSEINDNDVIYHVVRFNVNMQREIQAFSMIDSFVKSINSL